MAPHAPLPLSLTRRKRGLATKSYCQDDEDDDFDDEDDDAPVKKKHKPSKRKAKSPKPKKKWPFSQDNIDLFFRYLHRRMCVRVSMWGDATILGKNVPEPPHDPILDLCIMGNAYRHLDSEDHVDGAELLNFVGADLNSRPSDKQLAAMLIPCVLRCAGFNEQLMTDFFGRKGVLAAPMKREEALDFAKEMQRLAPRDHPDRPKDPSWFQGGASQVQGFGKWATAFNSWFVKPSGKGNTLHEVVTDLRAASTWEEANLIVQRLKCIGPYSAGQGLCTLAFGAYKGDAAKMFGDSYDPASIRTFCGFGPGPADSIEQLFGSEKKTLEGIRELVETADDTFRRLELPFPYLMEPDGTARPLGCVDIEHSLCYFSRYLAIKEQLGSAANEEKLWRSVRRPSRKGVGKAVPQHLKRMKLKGLVNLVGKGENFVGMDEAIRKLQERLGDEYKYPS